MIDGPGRNGFTDEFGNVDMFYGIKQIGESRKVWGWLSAEEKEKYKTYGKYEKHYKRVMSVVVVFSVIIGLVIGVFIFYLAMKVLGKKIF